MSNQIVLQLAVTLASLVAVNAHGYIVTWTMNGKEMKGFDPSWVQEPGGTAQRPYFEKERGFADYTKIDVACGGPDPGTNLETWPVAAGSNVTATWDQWPQPHEGPIMQYMAACPSTGCDGVDAAGLGWFKISEDAHDGTEWATDKLFRNPSWTFKIPEEVAPGFYLIRHEIIAMHFEFEPQVYPVCFQAEVSSSGSAVPAETVTFPNAYSSQSISNDFETFDVHNNQLDPTTFVPPGPAVAVLGKGTAPAESGSASAVASSAQSVEPSASQVGSGSGGSATDPSTSAASPQASDSPSENAPVADSPAPVEVSSQVSAPVSSDPAGGQDQGAASDALVSSPVSQQTTAASAATSGGGRQRPHRQGRPRACGAGTSQAV